MNDTNPIPPILGNIQFSGPGPYSADQEEEFFRRQKEHLEFLRSQPTIPMAGSVCCSPFDQPMSFRDFLRLKKEALEAYQAYLDQVDEWESFTGMDRKHAIAWPEALKGLTREDIEILKQ